MTPKSAARITINGKGETALPNGFRFRAARLFRAGPARAGERGSARRRGVVRPTVAISGRRVLVAGGGGALLLDVPAAQRRGEDLPGRLDQQRHLVGDELGVAVGRGQHAQA